MKKKIDILTQILEKKNIYLPVGAKKNEEGSIFKDKDRFHALVARTVRSPSVIIDYGASSHMYLSREALSSLDDLNGPNILVGDNSKTEIKGKGSIYFDHGSFNNVLYVPGLATNLLSVY